MRKTYLMLGSLGLLLGGAMLVGSPAKAAGCDAPAVQAVPHVREYAPVQRDHRNGRDNLMDWARRDWRDLKEFFIRHTGHDADSRCGCNRCDSSHPFCQDQCNGRGNDDTCSENGFDGSANGCGSGCPSCSNS